MSASESLKASFRAAVEADARRPESTKRHMPTPSERPPRGDRTKSYPLADPEGCTCDHWCDHLLIRNTLRQQVTYLMPTEAEMLTLRELLVHRSTILSGTNLPPTAVMLKDDVMPGLEQFRSLPVVRGPMNALVYEPVRRETCSA